MSKIYLIGCFIIALILPHLSADSMTMGDQILFQLIFLATGVGGFITFNHD